jgi:hypothetical protein
MRSPPRVRLPDGITRPITSGRTAPRRLAPRRRDRDRGGKPQPLLSGGRPQGSAQASKTCSQLSTRAACPDPRWIREAHRSSRTRRAGDTERTRHGGRDVLCGGELHEPHVAYASEPFGAGPISNSSRIVPTPGGPARITKRELFSDSSIPLSSRVRPTGGVRDSQGVALRPACLNRVS